MFLIKPEEPRGDAVQVKTSKPGMVRIYLYSKTVVNETPRPKERGIKITIPPCGAKGVVKKRCKQRGI